MSILDATFFHDETAAYAKLEAVLWPQGPECPHCGVVNEASRIAANPGKKVRNGLYRCNACKAQFTVTVGTIFESSHIPLHKWLQAAHLLNSSKKGISAKQIERILQITYKSAWFMMHRLREAMAEGALNPFGSTGGAVEADETYIGRWRRKGEDERSFQHKMKVLTLIDRETGQARSVVMGKINSVSVGRVVAANVAREARLMTDQSPVYNDVGRELAEHLAVNHSKEEYRRGDAYTNTAEGFFSIFKRGMKGVYQHCNEKHLHRYLAEFDFRYSNREALGVNDTARTERALQGAKGKRLTYRRTGSAFA
jgi:transposase-like protein